MSNPFCDRLVAIARGEQEYFDPSGIPTATEACKSNALMRCCKDLGVASELWYVVVICVRLCCIQHTFFNRDPRFIRKFKVEHGLEVFADHVTTKKKSVSDFRRLSPYFLNTFSIGKSSGVGKTNQS
jgi:Mitochondrial genome maintenance MGM101